MQPPIQTWIVDDTGFPSKASIRRACSVEPDGVVFDPATVKTERIKEDADYEGVRVRFVGLLGKARVTMQLDVGFGDVVVRRGGPHFNSIHDRAKRAETGHIRDDTWV